MPYFLGAWLLAAWMSAAGADLAPPRSLPVAIAMERPRILLTPAEREALRARVARDPWAAQVRDALVAEADAIAAAPLDIPRAGGQWSHWYVGEAGNRLVPRGPTEHVDPRTGRVYRGSPYDEAYTGMRHGYWLRGVQTLGMAYAIEARAAYAERVREILLEYASFYPRLWKHTKSGTWSRRGARLFAQTLDEAVILCHIVAGYDLVYDAPCFSEVDRERIAARLLRPMVRVVRARDSGRSNWQAWHNAAIGLTGFLLGDRALVDRALNGQSGLLFQLEHSLLPSGLWHELAPIYHWYALNAYVYLFEAAARAGIDCYALPKVRGMFDAPVRGLLPDATFAPLQDSDRLALSDDRWYYEVAHRRYGDPRYAAFAGARPEGEAILHKSEDLPESRALGLEAAALALFWGVEALPEPPPALEWASSNDPDEGLAVLRDAANETVILLDYGPASAGHVQPAKLNVVIYAAGDIRLIDPGRAPYGHPLHAGWCRQTVAHNTVVVDETSQQPARGAVRAFAAEEGWSLVRASCEDAYPGVALDRTVMLRDNVVVDIFHCVSDTARIFDLPLHFGDKMTWEGKPSVGAVARSRPSRDASAWHAGDRPQHKAGDRPQQGWHGHLAHVLNHGRDARATSGRPSVGAVARSRPSRDASAWHAGDRPQPQRLNSDAPGYREMRDLRRASAASVFEVRLREGARLHVVLLDAGEVWTGTGPGPIGSDSRTPFVLRRQQGRSARFVTVLQVLGEKEAPYAAAVREDGAVIFADACGQEWRIRSTEEDTIVSMDGREWRERNPG